MTRLALTVDGDTNLSILLASGGSVDAVPMPMAPPPPSSAVIIQIDEDATIGGFQEFNSIGFIQHGDTVAGPIECTFTEWSDGDILYVTWQATGQDVSGSGGIMGCSPWVSLDGGSTWSFVYPAMSAGETYSDLDDGYVSCLTGLASVAIAGTTPPLVRLSHSVSSGLIYMGGNGSGTGAVLHIERRPASLYRRPPPGGLFPT